VFLLALADFRWYSQLFLVRVGLVLGPPFSLFSQDGCCCTDVVMCKRVLDQYVWLRTLGILCPFLWAKSGSLVLQRHKYIKAELQIYFYHYKSPMIKMARVRQKHVMLKLANRNVQKYLTVVINSSLRGNWEETLALGFRFEDRVSKFQ